MAEETVIEFVSKRVERLTALEKLVYATAADMKEMKYQVTQYDAKVRTFESQILAKKAEIVDLDEQIRRKKIEVAGSFNNLRDDLSRRELALTKALAELKVSQENTKARAAEAEALIIKAEKAIGDRQSAPPPPKVVQLVPAAPATAPVMPEKRSPGRPRKEVAA